MGWKIEALKKAQENREGKNSSSTDGNNTAVNTTPAIEKSATINSSSKTLLIVIVLFAVLLIVNLFLIFGLKSSLADKDAIIMRLERIEKLVNSNNQKTADLSDNLVKLKADFDILSKKAQDSISRVNQLQAMASNNAQQTEQLNRSNRELAEKLRSLENK